MRKTPFRKKNKHRDAETEWSRAVIARDKNVCQRCRKYGWHAHHKAPRSQRPDLKFSVGNGICLCFPCHNFIHDNPIQAEKDGFLDLTSYESVHSMRFAK